MSNLDQEESLSLPLTLVDKESSCSSSQTTPAAKQPHPEWTASEGADITGNIDKRGSLRKVVSHCLEGETTDSKFPALTPMQKFKRKLGSKFIYLQRNKRWDCSRDSACLQWGPGTITLKLKSTTNQKPPERRAHPSGSLNSLEKTLFWER